VDRPPADGDLGQVVDPVGVDRVLAVEPHQLAVVAGVEAVLPRVPVVERAVLLGQVGVVQARRNTRC
jgi:hypothetical protein